MRSLRFVLACVLLIVGRAIAQTTLQFEVASVRPTPGDNSGPPIGMRITGARIQISGYSLKDYIGMAYSLEPPQVIAPEWMATQRFEIAGNLPVGSTRQQLPQMIQALLIDRFQLKVHKESREFPVYALTVSRGGLKITGTPVDPTAPQPPATEVNGSGSPAGVVISMGAGSFGLADNRLEVKNLTMPELANSLTRFSERKTIDATGVTDRFTFTLELSQEDYGFAMMRAAINNGYPVSPQGLRALDAAPSNVLGGYIARTGLVLEERRAPLDVVVVDSALRTPTEN